MEPGQPTDLFPPADGDRPPYSYKELIIKAFELVKSKPLELRDIYFLISGIFPYYKPGGAWQTAVRHVLLSDDLFSSDIKTNYWRMNTNISYTSQPSHNLNIFESCSTVPTSALLTSNTISSNLCSGLTYCRSYDDPRTSPYSHYGNLYSSNEYTVPYFSINQPRMSSNQILNRWIDDYQGESTPEQTNWQSTETSDLSKALFTQPSFSDGSFTDSRFLNQNNFKGHVQPVRPNVRRAIQGSCDNLQNKFSPFSHSTNSDLSLKEGSVKLDFTTKNPNQGSFNLYNAHTSSSDCRQAGMGNNESHLNMFGNFNSRNYSKSLLPIHSELYSHPQNSYRGISNSFFDSFYGNKHFNTSRTLPHEISSQFISVNVHPPQCLYQNQTQHPELNNVTNPRPLQHEKNLSSENGIEASIKNHAVSNIVNNGCQDSTVTCENNESPSALGFVNEFIRSIMPQPGSLSQNFELATLTDQRKETNCETSLININIHLPALGNTNKYKMLSNKQLASDNDVEIISSNNDTVNPCTVPDVVNQPVCSDDVVNQPVSSDFSAFCPSVMQEYTESQDSKDSEVDSIVEITKAIPEMNGADISASKTNLNKSDCKDKVIAVSGSTVSEMPVFEPEKDEEVITLDSIDAVHLKDETSIVQDKTTPSKLAATCSWRSIVDNCVDCSEKETSSDETSIVQDKTTPDELAATSSCRSTVDNCVDCSEKETSLIFDPETHSPSEPVLTIDSNLQNNSDIVSSDVSISTSAANIPFTDAKDCHKLSLLNITSETLCQNSVLIFNDENSSRDSGSTLLEALKHKNKVKMCSVILKKIKLPAEKYKSNSEPCKKLLDKNFTANSSSQDLENEDLPITSGDNSQLQGESPGGQGPHSDGTSQGNGNKLAQVKSKRFLPQEIKGFTKPSYNYCRLITQALANFPGKKATALEICDMIAIKHPYYEYLTSFDWKSSIIMQLRTRKKFFTIIGTDEKNDPIWSFNPTFEKFMFDKWVPKYVQNKMLFSSKQNDQPSFHETYIQQPNPPESSNCSTIEDPTTVTTNSKTPNPVIEFSGSLLSVSSPNEILSIENTNVLDSDSSSSYVPVRSEIAGKEADIEQNVEDVQPSDSQAIVSDEIPTYATQPPNNLVAVSVQGTRQISKVPALQPYYKPYNHDFAMENMNIKSGISAEEVHYRKKFNTDHPELEKFRLHCTVCDDHLGTSGTVCQRKARLHPMLGTLVCSKCYSIIVYPSSSACQWCAQVRTFHSKCAKCKSSCCKVCIERNFGLTFSVVMLKNKDWLCFQCDAKQIWPHRAIASSLLQHYKNLRITRDAMSKSTWRPLNPKELRFFIKDLSTCCTSSTPENKQPKKTKTVKYQCESPATMGLAPGSPAMSESVKFSSLPPHNTTSVSSQSPLFVIGEQPNYIYVQASTTVPSVTLNTGTQYIQNVYPDKNYVVVNNSVDNRFIPAVNTSPLSNSILYSQSPSTINSLVPVFNPPPSYPNSTLQNSTVGIEINKAQGEVTKDPVSNTSREMEGNFTTPKLSESNNVLSVAPRFQLGVRESDETIIIPDVDLPIESKKQDDVFAAPVMSARERIERRPMPKSKKQSLLKTVLMCESIESMKRQLMLHSSTVNVNNDVSVSSPIPKISHKSTEHIEEPILKSIIETATERLLNLQKNQVVASNTEETSLLSTGSFPETVGDLDPLSLAECRPEKNNTTIPKIKIKTLKELQDPNVFRNDPNNKEKHTSINEKVDQMYLSPGSTRSPGTDNTNQCKMEIVETNKKNESGETGIDITDLKQSIIEAAKTLINTQKQFKELAKVISSNLIYKPDKAVELIIMFHDILKICHKELDQIGGNINEKFGHLLPSSNIDSILREVENRHKRKTDHEDDTISSQKRKREKTSSLKDQKDQEEIESRSSSLMYPENSGMDQNYALSNSIDPNKSCVQKPIKRKRDLVDFNPLGKKVILGSPDVTEEDLRRIPDTWDASSLADSSESITSHNKVYMEELRRYQYLAKKAASKKKNIWASSRRKKRKYKKHPMQLSVNVPLVYNEDGTLMKKRKYKKRRKRLSESDDDDETYKPNHPQRRIQRRKTVSEPKSLRLSARKHPSTAAHVAQLMYYPAVKPCSVILVRLDPRVVHNLTKCSINTSGFGEEN